MWQPAVIVLCKTLDPWLVSLPFGSFTDENLSETNHFCLRFNYSLLISLMSRNNITFFLSSIIYTIIPKKGDMRMTTALSLEQVSYSYHTMKQETTALSSITFDVLSGEFVAVVGPSGCGKSTMLHLIAKTAPSVWRHHQNQRRTDRGIHRPYRIYAPEGSASSLAHYL